MMTKTQKLERAEAIADLRKWLVPGDTVHTICDHVSSSGMSRAIRVIVLKTEGDRVTDLHPNWLVGKALGLRHWRQRGHERDALVVGGCGMDMGFHLVYELSSVLFPEGFGCIGAGCPSNDHSNGDRDHTPHSAEAPHWHNSGGYALRQRWL